MNLYEDHPNVPQSKLPLLFSTDRRMTANTADLDRWIYYYQDRLPTGVRIDEASILASGIGEVWELQDYLRAEGWEEFNNAGDVVFTNPFGTRYTVDYHFFRREGVPYRLEVMCLMSGFSPLHQSLLRMANLMPGQYPVPHLSFKPIRRDLSVSPDGMTAAGAERLQTWRGAYGEAVQYLKDHACIHAQSCQSTYGQFGYFLGNDATRQVYVKPRINLRDGVSDDVMHSMCTVDSHDGCLVDHTQTERPR